MPRPRTKALTLIKAADLLRAAEIRLESAQRGLTKAIKAREDAEAVYLQLVTETLAARRQGPVHDGGEAMTPA